VIQEWQQGLPLEEVRRRHGINASKLQRWKKAMDRSLKDSGEMIPGSQVGALHRL